ncbi:FadR/GntR family transcriptional regulator [Kordiimonas sp. SCSIO 12610]|uniref:FadR/GntR family transcriptional regulator n=1 Tax=Kordiimonas sp. SCSIO 12610 TaxID=2829597 RepID=UPI00210A41C5|nr:GntR family transcriptional regulator [Kordiimonas sp. SCSIO 12610]UTW54640.1 FadR family transcriptional regulator [Kordiimonas sp. SCSIO 12610]
MTNQQNTGIKLSRSPKAKRIKLSESVANDLLERIVSDGMQPGDRLPKEVELIAEFGCSKSTLREALKSIENQGLITIETGPKGGARLIDVSYSYANKSLRNYFRFKNLSTNEIYDVREPLEIALCSSVIGNISKNTFSELKKLLDKCEEFLDTPETNIDIWRLRRKTEIEFNSIIAQQSPNQLLGFLCLFINDLISDTIIENFMYFHSSIKEEYGKTAYKILKQYYECLIREDEEGAIASVRERMAFIRSVLNQVKNNPEL